MTVPTTFVALRYNGAGVTGPFSVPYQFGQDAFLRVRKTDTAGSVTTLVLNVDYTVTGAGLAAGGNVTLTVALAVGEVLEIDLGGTLLTQATDYVNGGKVDFETLEDSFDNRTLTDQWLQQQINRTVRVTDGTLAELPGVSDRASMVLGFDAGGAPAVVASTTLGAEVFHEEQFTTTAPNTTITLLNAPAGDNLIDVYVEDAWQPSWTRVGQVITLTGTPAGLSGYVQYYERLPFYQAIGETIESGMRYGISNTLTSSQTTAFQSAIDSSASGIIGLPPHDYTVTASSLTGMDRDTGAAFIGFGATINGYKSLRHGLRGVFFTEDGLMVNNYDLWLSDNYQTPGTINTSDSDTLLRVTIETDPTSDAGVWEPQYNKTGASFRGVANGAERVFNIYTQVVNDSTGGPGGPTNSRGSVAYYGRYMSTSNANWGSGTHSETRHGGGVSSCLNLETAIYSTSGVPYGIVVLNSTSGAEKNGYDATYEKELNANATGLLIHGVDWTDNDAATGKNDGVAGKSQWARGIDFTPGSIRAAGQAIRLQSPAVYQIHGTSSAVSSTADILLEADSGTGMVLSGTYTSSNAIRIAGGQAVAWEGTGSARTYYNSASSQFRFALASTDRITLEMDPTPRVLLNGTQVLRERITGWGAPTGTATRTTFDTATVTLVQLAQRVKALIDDGTTHGLIGA